LRARLVLLRDRLRDERSGTVVFLAHCLLNQNVRYLGGASHSGIVEEAVEEARRQGHGVYQLPCPEQRAWGGVLKRITAPVYDAEGTLRYRLRRPLLWLANLAGASLDDVIAAAERGIQRIRDTHWLAFSFLRYCGLSLR
jgi:hypothetical protein